MMEPFSASELESSSDASWRWRNLPNTSRVHAHGGGCVLGDGRFAVFGESQENNNRTTATCEVLTLKGDTERWDPLPPMQEPRANFACAAVGGCVIVAGGSGFSHGGGVRGSARAVEAASLQPSPQLWTQLYGQRADVNPNRTWFARTFFFHAWVRTEI